MYNSFLNCLIMSMEVRKLEKTPNITRIVMGIILLILGLCIERKIVFWIKRNYVIKFVVNPKMPFFGLDIVHIVFIDLGCHQEGKK